ncbi:MAG: hypothetical protein MZV64_30805 [Ignavibacteriales bacterium]|nr:hypothetical protein [Ignavibacteriales bacterium]
MSSRSWTTWPAWGRSKTTAVASLKARVRLEDGPRRLGRQQVTDQRAAVPLLDQRAAAHDEGERPVELVDDRPGEVEPPPRHERHLDAGVGGAADRVAVRRRHLPAAVEERAVDVQGDQSNHSRG